MTRSVSSTDSSLSPNHSRGRHGSSPGHYKTLLSETKNYGVLKSYNYEWAEEGFFNKRGNGKTPPASSGFGPYPPADGMPTPWNLSSRLEKFHIMEVAWGSRQAVEVTVGDILKKVRAHKWPGNNLRQQNQPRGRTLVPEITYRDLAQIFTETSLVPAFEIRQNCIVLCLPPLTCIVLHDRVMLHVNNLIDLDCLLLRLEELTGAYNKRADETQEFFLRHIPNNGTPDRGEKLSLRTYRSMLLSNELIEAGAIDENQITSPTSSLGNVAGIEWSTLHNAMVSGNLEVMQSVPRFVLFPLEFALLEVLISFAFTELDKEVVGLEKEAQDIIEESNKKTYNTKLIDAIKDIKLPISNILETVVGLSEALTQILDTPEDMAMMELTRLFYQSSYDQHHEINPNLEILLEFFSQEINLIQNRVKKINSNLETAEKHILMIMSFRRNQLHKWDIGCNIATVGLGIGAVISGILGMNVPNFQEESDRAFFLYVIAIILIAVIGFALAFFVSFKTVV